MTAIPSVPTVTHASRFRIGRPDTNTLLWAAQVALGALFIFAGGFKLLMSAADLGEGTALPVGFMRFIGVCELLGGFGLIVPGTLRFARVLTPLAATGLVIIMIGAVATTVIEVSAAAAIVPFVVGAALVSVIRGRRSWFSA